MRCLKKQQRGLVHGLKKMDAVRDGDKGRKQNSSDHGIYRNKSTW